MKNQKTIQTLLAHLLFWVGVWFFFYYFFSYNSSDQFYNIWFSSLLLPVTATLTYVVVAYLIPKFLLTKKYFLFALYSFYAMVLSSYFIVLIIYWCLLYLLQFNIEIMPPMSRNFFFILTQVYLIAGILSFISLLQRNFKTISRNRELETKILSTELALKNQELKYLKMQIHPHFLFNTLNTIYGLSIRHSPQTPEVILKLSNLLDYILYQINKPRVDLKEEALHIQEYTELERIRFQDNLIVDFSTYNIDKHIQIAPMLLIPFVENAFKHGNIIDGYLRVSITISVNGNSLFFETQNTFLAQENNKGTQGIGLENIKKRLEMFYPERFEISHSIQNSLYCAQLIIHKLNR